MINPFFKNNGPFKISDILQQINLDDLKIDNDYEIIDIKDLFTSKKNDITFFHSKKYKDIAKNTKASFCLTTEILKGPLFLKKGLDINSFYQRRLTCVIKICC